MSTEPPERRDGAAAASASSPQPRDAGNSTNAGPADGPSPGHGASEPPRSTPPQSDPAAGLKQKSKPQQPGVNRQDVSEYADWRGRASHDGVVFSNCNITADSFTGRDSWRSSGRDLFLARVPLDRLAKLTDVFEQPDCAPAAGGRLKSDRLVCLRGAEGTGKTALAIQLLREHAGDGVWEIRPHTSIAELPEARFDRDRGYFLSISPTDAITEFELTRLRSICEDSACYLALICVGKRAENPLDSSVVEVAAPRTDRVALLRKHAVRGLAHEIHSTVDDLLTRPEVLGWCRGSHRLAEFEDIARIIADVARGRIGDDALAKHLDFASQDGIRTWFEGEGKQALRPLIVTLSFFGGLPLQTVLELENRLSIRLREAAGETQPRDLFAVSGRARLTEVSAHVSSADHEDLYGAARTEIVEFADLTWEKSLAVLLRTGYPSVRPVFIAWLRELADHPDPLVQRCAALALGSFTEVSMSVLIHDVIEPWARLPGPQSWQRVVGALTGALVTNPDTAPRVSRALEQWAVSGDPELVFSAAMVYGIALAPDNPPGALSGLARIARQKGPDGEAWTAQAASGVTAMYLSDLTTDVLTAMRRWTRSKRKTERELALLAFLWIAEWVEDAVPRTGPPDADAGTRPGRKKQAWPSLLLAARREETRSEVIAISREALNNPRSSLDAIAALRHWFTWANDRPYLVQPLTEFIAALAATPDEAERLAYYLQAWGQKNPKGAAARVCKALLEPSGRGRVL